MSNVRSLDQLPHGKLSELFDHVVQLVRDSPNDNGSYSSNEYKLRLYGLFKRSTVGRWVDTPQQPPSIFQVSERAKFQAWRDCDEMATHEAMMQYISAISTQQDALGGQCRKILEEQLQPNRSDTTIPTMHSPVPVPELSFEQQSSRSMATSLYAWLVWFLSVLLDWIGVKPLVPRGRLDISFVDLLFAAVECCRLGSNTNAFSTSMAISTLWKERTGEDVIAGLSVRSLLDLYLTTKCFVKGSQVIVVPPISVPGMIHVLKHHEIDIVAVDSNPTDNEWFITQDVDRSITPLTVAILVVHPFGRVCASSAKMQELRALADSHGLELWEDCAQCFTGFGEDCYLGWQHSDLKFFSFGPIKTSTALGGGIISFRDPDRLQSVERVQNTLANQQTVLQFLQKVTVATVLNSIAGSQWRVGLLKRFCQLMGWDFDVIVTKSLRGFRIRKQTGGATESQVRLELIKQIRKRPSVPLLKLLLRRLQQGHIMLPSVRQRLSQCQQMEQLISKSKPNALMPFEANHNCYWTFPIRCIRRNDVARILQRKGYDVTTGASQMCCVSSSSHKATAPRVTELMESILYIPVTTNVMSPYELQTFSNEIVFALNGIENESNVHHLSRKESTILWLIRRKFADQYLKGSTAFAEHCDIVNNQPCQQGETPTTNNVSSESMLSQMEVLSIPTSITSRLSGQTVLLTGATGFVGSLLLRDLLLHREKLAISRVIVLCRGKKGKDPIWRIHKLLEDNIFSFLSDEEKSNLVSTVQGDVSSPMAGISEMSLVELISGDDISHVFHCAAEVSFIQELADAAKSNVTSSLNMQALSQRLGATFVHVSTSFVHGGLSGSTTAPLSEQLFPLAPFNAREIYTSMLGTQYYASKAMTELRFPNSYTFSKCVCEHLLAEGSSSSSRTIILRPSIVGPAFETPFEGWAGHKPSTIVAGACLHLSTQWNLWYLQDTSVPYIPVDVLTRFIISKAFIDPLPSLDNTSSSDGSFEKLSSSDAASDSDESSLTTTSKIKIYNATWDTTSECNSSFTWLEFAVTYLQLGCVLGYFGRALAYLTLLFSANLVPTFISNEDSYRQWHILLIRGPFRVMIALSEAFSLSTTALRQLMNFLDLPLLFFPFVKRPFHFQSDLVAPHTFNPRRYVFNTAVAAHKFVSEKSHDPNTSKVFQKPTEYAVGGELHSPAVSDTWWVLSQPLGTVSIRLCAWILTKILRKICSIVTVDIPSFRNVLQLVEATDSTDQSYIILAPTHRSFLDFMLLSYIFFAIPELQMEIPFIVAASDFQGIPFVGWGARLLRAIYISRGKGFEDPVLNEQMKQVKTDQMLSSGSCLELFIEGTRSRDRRFVRARTGCLKSLGNTGGRHVVIPIAINYEAIPEQESLVREALGGSRPAMTFFGLIGWLGRVFNGKVKLGAIHVVAAEPLVMPTTSDEAYHPFVEEVQRRQMNATRISEYHTRAASRLLRLPLSDMRTAFVTLGCKFMPTSKEERESEYTFPRLPVNESELAAIALQGGHWLAPMFRVSHPEWAQWLGSSTMSSYHSIHPCTSATCEVLGGIFGQASKSVDLAIEKLKDQGFRHPRFLHVLQTAKHLDVTTPVLFLHAAVSMRIGGNSRPCIDDTSNPLRPPPGFPSNPMCLLDRDERLGFWGFSDTKFVIQARNSGKTVTMQGKRYGLSGRSMSSLLPFMEKEMNVQIDPRREFPVTSTIWNSPIPTRLNKHDREFIDKTFHLNSFETHKRVRHGTGQSQEDIFAIRAGERLRIPDAVIWPTSEAEVEELVGAAATYSWCLIPFGGGTNVSNATRCPDEDVEPRPIISVDMKEMNKILWLNEEDGMAHVQAGIVGRDLVHELEKRGVTMGHEPDSIEFSTLGGWIATKASGMKRSQYGNIEDIVKSMRVVGPRGIVWSGDDNERRYAPGRVAEGMDANSLFIGSEGCLGIVTSAVIRVWPVPEVTSYDSIVFQRFEDGLRFVKSISQSPRHSPASVRLLDNAHFRLGQALRPSDVSLVEQFSKVAAKSVVKLIHGPLDESTVVCATIGYEGSKTDVTQQKQFISSLARRYGGIRLGAAVGKSGYDLTFMIAYLRDFAMTYHLLAESFETFVPWSKLESMISATKQRILTEHRARFLPGNPFVGSRVTQLYHEGACVYFYLCISFDGVPNASEVFSSLEAAARDEILKHGGSLSHHHGIGKHRAPQLKGRSSPAMEEAQWRIKESMDDLNIFGARNCLYHFTPTATPSTEE
eukprot:Nitzschia sp. Nitz4//scaffold213_size37731//277//7089//NITZ4_007715-RA/size37731-processed-gene-0.0-mRNA-1//1//CDS//3329542050//8294//frame0